jgi:hypothetical protein
MPSISNFLGITIPREQLMEIDGVSLTGAISAVSPGAKLEDGKIKITWRSTGGKGDVKIWLTTTNKFKDGGRDVYVLKATLPVSKEEAVINVNDSTSKFYKIVIEAPGNFLNRWIEVK